MSGDRLGAELRLALDEPDPLAALQAVAALNPAYLPEGFDPHPRALAAALELLPGDGRRDLLALAACTAGMDARALLAWLDDMGFVAADRDLVAAASRYVHGRAAARGAHDRRDRAGPRVARRSRRSRSPAARTRAAGSSDLRHVRLEINGDDLLAAGVPEGPEIGARAAARAGPQARRRDRRARGGAGAALARTAG